MALAGEPGTGSKNPTLVARAPPRGAAGPTPRPGAPGGRARAEGRRRTGGGRRKECRRGAQECVPHAAAQRARSVFHEVSRTEGPSQQTANFRQTAPEIHVSPRFKESTLPSLARSAVYDTILSYDRTC